MSAQNSSDHTNMDAQDHNNETGNDKPSRHGHQQNLNHPSGLHPAKVKTATSDPVDKSSNRSMKKQMEVAVGETEEKSPSFKRPKGDSKASAKDVDDNGYENDDLNPLNVVTARGSSIKANQDRPIYSKMKVTAPNNDTSSGAKVCSDLEIEKDYKKTDAMTIRQEDIPGTDDDIPGTDDDSTLNQNNYLPLSNNQPVYGAEEDHQIQSSSELMSHRPERYEIRKRRHDALEGLHEFTSTDTAKDNDNSLVTFAVNQIESDTIQKLLEDVVEEAQRRKRRSIQETNQQEHTLEASATNEVEQAISTATNSPDVDHSLSEEANNDDNIIAQDKCQEARQSCKEMDYTEEQIDQAINEYHRRHGGSNDYSGVDLASLMEMREDEVQDATDDQRLPSSSHNPQNDNKELAAMATGGRQYTAIATVTDIGHPSDYSSRHTIYVEVPLKRCNCGCEPEIICNFS